MHPHHAWYVEDGCLDCTEQRYLHSEFGDFLWSCILGTFRWLSRLVLVATKQTGCGALVADESWLGLSFLKSPLQITLKSTMLSQSIHVDLTFTKWPKQIHGNWCQLDSLVVLWYMSEQVAKKKRSNFNCFALRVSFGQLTKTIIHTA